MSTFTTIAALARLTDRELHILFTTVTERLATYGEGTPERREAFWTQIGSAWPHKDGKGLNVQLKPNIAVTGRIVLREWDDERPARQKSAA